ncbi:MAG: signal recognition particle-docking protein FtsY [Bacteroidia bacterium]|nr:signal recognition particle-docking protein FtsY [Bacteroidia bacterium]
MGLFDFLKKTTPAETERLDSGLTKSRQGFFTRLGRSIVGKSTVDEEVLDALEDTLLQSDVGVDTTVKIIARIRAHVAQAKYTSTEELGRLLREAIAGLLHENRATYATEKLDQTRPTVAGKPVPYVIMVVGVNGVGKTTTIGKLAHRFTAAGHTVLLGAGDTFRAAAVDQLRIWAERVGAGFATKGMNTDPAAVAYDAVRQGLDQGVDLVIVDTAGRLHNKVPLMNELSKIKRTMEKVVPGAPHEVLLVLDASTGQNALQQAKAFGEATEVTALALTKLDGTAKGGVVLAIADQLKIPVKYIGVGEQLTDLQLFDPDQFVERFFAAEGLDL